MAEPEGSGQGALPPRFRPSCDGCGKRFPVDAPSSRWAYEEGKNLVEREFCPKTKDECRARYEQALVPTSPPPAPADQEGETPASPEQLILFD